MSYVYVKSEPGLWTVGFYAPNDKFIAESDHESPERAASRCRHLNGGSNRTDEIQCLEKALFYIDHYRKQSGGDGDILAMNIRTLLRRI